MTALGLVSVLGDQREEAVLSTVTVFLWIAAAGAGGDFLAAPAPAPAPLPPWPPKPWWLGRAPIAASSASKSSSTNPETYPVLIFSALASLIGALQECVQIEDKHTQK